MISLSVYTLVCISHVYDMYIHTFYYMYMISLSVYTLDVCISHVYDMYIHTFYHMYMISLSVYIYTFYHMSHSVYVQILSYVYDISYTYDRICTYTLCDM